MTTELMETITDTTLTDKKKKGIYHKPVLLPLTNAVEINGGETAPLNENTNGVIASS